MVDAILDLAAIAVVLPFDARGLVAAGRVTRVVVNRQRFLDKLEET